MAATAPTIVDSKAFADQSEQLSRRQTASIFWRNSLLCCTAIGIGVAIQLCAVDCGIVDRFITDVFTFQHYLTEVVIPSRHPFLDIFYPEDPGMRAQLVLIIYWPFCLLDPLVCLVPNVLMMVASIWLAARVFEFAGAITQRFACCAIALNPYLIFAAHGPNREIMLTLLTLWFMWLLHVRRSILGAMFVCLLAQLARSNYGSILGLWLLFQTLRSYRLGKLAELAPLALPIFIVLLLPLLENISADADRILIMSRELAESTGSRLARLSVEGLRNPIVAMIAYALRIVVNGFFTAFRPSLFDELGNISLIGAGYWLYGIALAIGLTGVLWFLPRLSCTSPDLRRNVLFVTYLWMACSVIPFPHVRYLMPLLPPALGVFGAAPRSFRLITYASLPFALVIGLIFTVYVWGMQAPQ